MARTLPWSRVQIECYGTEERSKVMDNTYSKFMVGMIGIALLLAAGVSAADQGAQAMQGVQQHNRYGDEHQAMADHVSARAALEPIGMVEGWGHAMVRDQITTAGDVRRLVGLRVVGLDPETEYTATVTGTEGLDDAEFNLGSLITDENGDGLLRLGWPETVFPPVPGDIPPAEVLVLARVYDLSQALALEGEFSVDWVGGSGPCELVYVERIVLTPTDDPRLKGVAKVTRTEDDVEIFESRACRLEPESAYQVLVDGIVAAVVTTDGVGHGELVLSSGDGSLPAELQPIEDLRIVEWATSDGQVILSGTFTGENMAGGHGGGVPGGSGNGEPGQGDGGGAGHGGDNGGGDGGGDGGGNGGGSGGGNGGGNGGGGNP